MKTEKITRIKLIADDGMMLTNGDTYGKEVYLGTEDIGNWYEITEAEYEEVNNDVLLE